VKQSVDRLPDRSRMSVEVPRIHVSTDEDGSVSQIDDADGPSERDRERVDELPQLAGIPIAHTVGYHHGFWPRRGGVEQTRPTQQSAASTLPERNCRFHCLAPSVSLRVERHCPGDTPHQGYTRVKSLLERSAVCRDAGPRAEVPIRLPLPMPPALGPDELRRSRPATYTTEFQPNGPSSRPNAA